MVEKTIRHCGVNEWAYLHHIYYSASQHKASKDILIYWGNAVGILVRRTDRQAGMEKERTGACKDKVHGQ